MREEPERETGEEKEYLPQKEYSPQKGYLLPNAKRVSGSNVSSSFCQNVPPEAAVVLILSHLSAQRALQVGRRPLCCPTRTLQSC